MSIAHAHFNEKQRDYEKKKNQDTWQEIIFIVI